MKKLFFLISAISILFLAVSCSSNNDDDTVTDILNTEGSWQLGDFTYSAGVTVQDNDSSERVIIVASTDQDTSQGSASGAGEYTITDFNTMVINPDQKLIAISCTIGTASVDATRYDSVGDILGTAVMVEDDEIYNVSITEPTILTKTIEVGDGVPNAEDTYEFTAFGIQ